MARSVWTHPLKKALAGTSCEGICGDHGKLLLASNMDGHLNLLFCGLEDVLKSAQDHSMCWCIRWFVQPLQG